MAGDPVVLSLLSLFATMLADKVGLLARYLQAESPWTRACAARLLGEIHVPDCITALMTCIQNEPHQDVIMAAAVSIVGFNEEASFQAICDRFMLDGSVGIAKALLCDNGNAVSYVPRILDRLLSVPEDAATYEQVEAIV